jgi:hypothetical protein
VLDQLVGLFGCEFTVTVRAEGGTGQDVVRVTLTATPLLGRPVRVTFSAKANTPTAVTVTFARPCPMGIATAVSVPPSASPSNAAPFGLC